MVVDGLNGLCGDGVHGPDAGGGTGVIVDDGASVVGHGVAGVDSALGLGAGLAADGGNAVGREVIDGVLRGVIPARTAVEDSHDG